ncbi:hypothetical protein [Microvirga pudoricolor]|uniref:hypothetical protein n=1 Tax=Microvirga pudoricolor TaxID=2778729 RepID=UPI00194E57BB|nr:hypothetical protein [Microvirga pudoricolor]MBM6596443.1 hypothetical protein [Microvirga pudoricolor]
MGSPGSAPSTLSAPTPPPGTEGSSGSPATGNSATGAVNRAGGSDAAGGVGPGGGGRATGGATLEPQKTDRERELDRQARRIDEKVRRGICQGC